MGFEFDTTKFAMNLNAIRENMARNGQRRAVLAGAKVIATAMEENAPVQAATNLGSDSLEPGELKESIYARTKTVDGQVIGLAGPRIKDAGFPAYLVEYGHRMVTGGQSRLGADGKFHGKRIADGVFEDEGTVHEIDVPAYPFLRPAAESSAREALVAMAESLSKTMREGVKNV